ncbi:YecM protein [Serratia sp. DD3]|nr:YecM protein [Serratia sp. DD3]
MINIMTDLLSINELNDLALDLPRFEQALSEFAQKLHLELSQYHADHISLRCHQDSTAERWRQGLLQCGVLLSENIINGRVICLFDLTVPLQVGPWQIDCIELPYPGKKRYPHEGWEHVELVLAGDPATLYTRALEQLADEALLQPGISLKQSWPKSEDESLANPTLAVSDGQVTIKFHPHSIRDVVTNGRA